MHSSSDIRLFEMKIEEADQYIRRADGEMDPVMASRWRTTKAHYESELVRAQQRAAEERLL